MAQSTVNTAASDMGWPDHFDLYCMYRSRQNLGFPSPLGSSSDSSSSVDGAASDEDEDGGSDDEGSD
jgi:hypothetical protein